MPSRLSGTVAVITGSSMGIGEAVARLFVREGASVVLSSRDQARAEAARSRIIAAMPDAASRTLALHCDVRNREEIDRVLSLTLHNFGRVDIWINNAGHGLIDAVATMDMSQCKSMFETNLFGAIHGLQIAAAAMKRQGGGTIINVSSVAGHIPLPGSAAYSSTKFALNAISKAARAELKRNNIHVMTVCPGYIGNDFAKNAIKGVDHQRIGEAARKGATSEDVAHALLNGYLKRKREVIVPWWYWFPIKLYQTFPGLLENFMGARLRPADQVIAEAQAKRAR
jgi:short-subunit dehydrogenase